MKMVVLNKPALWRPIRSEETSVRKYSNAYPYETKRGLIVRSSIDKPVIRYAKNFTKFKTDFSLFIFSDVTDLNAVESYLNKVASSLKKAEISETVKNADMSNFKYLDTFYGESK